MGDCFLCHLPHRDMGRNGDVTLAQTLAQRLLHPIIASERGAVVTPTSRVRRRGKPSGPCPGARPGVSGPEAEGRARPLNWFSLQEGCPRGRPSPLGLPWTRSEPEPEVHAPGACSHIPLLGAQEPTPQMQTRGARSPGDLPRPPQGSAVGRARAWTPGAQPILSGRLPSSGSGHQPLSQTAPV